MNKFILIFSFFISQGFSNDLKNQTQEVRRSSFSKAIYIKIQIQNESYKLNETSTSAEHPGERHWVLTGGKEKLGTLSRKEGRFEWINWPEKQVIALITYNLGLKQFEITSNIEPKKILGFIRKSSKVSNQWDLVTFNSSEKSTTEKIIATWNLKNPGEPKKNWELKTIETKTPIPFEIWTAFPLIEEATNGKEPDLFGGFSNDALNGLNDFLFGRICNPN